MEHIKQIESLVHYKYSMNVDAFAETLADTSLPAAFFDCDRSRPSQSTQSSIRLDVYQAGKLTVIGFGGREFLDQLNFSEFDDEIMSLIRTNRCHTLALDLTGIRLIPSGLLGVLMSVHRQQVDILLFNASRDIQEVLEITKLDKILQLHEVLV